MGNLKRPKKFEPENDSAAFSAAYGKTVQGKVYRASIQNSRCPGILDCYDFTAEGAKQKLIKKLRAYANWLDKNG